MAQLILLEVYQITLNSLIEIPDQSVQTLIRLFRGSSVRSATCIDLKRSKVYCDFSG